jgi:hypothetical protein
MVTREATVAFVPGRPWHHAFDVIPRVRAEETYDPRHLWDMLACDLGGSLRRDVVASNGFFSFEARKRGARVVAFDFRYKDNFGFGLIQHINRMSDASSIIRSTYST